MSDLISKGITIEQLKLLPVQLDAETVQRCIEAVSNLRTVNAMPIIPGYWITEECLPGIIVCSNCGFRLSGLLKEEAHYCPNCGSKMGGKRKEE